MRRHALFLLVAICGALLAVTDFAEPVDLRVLDLQYRVLRAWWPQPAPREVVVVGIDADTEKAFPEPIALWHGHLARFFAAMALAKPAAVGVDMVLPDRPFDPVLPGSDVTLMKGLLEARRSYPLVLALTVDPAGNRRSIHPPFAAVAGSGATGYALFPVDGDGVVRRYDEALSEGGGHVATLVGQMARRMGLDPGPGLIDYDKGPLFEYVPLHQVLRWADEGNNTALAAAFGGRPVLLGMILPFVDRLRAPVPLSSAEPAARDSPGVLVQAQALRSMLNGGLIRPAPAAAVVVLSVAAALLWLVSTSTGAAVAATVAIGALLAACSTLLLTKGWHLPVAAPALTAFFALGGRNGYDVLLKLRERRRLRSSFSGYVSPAVMAEILAGRLRPELGGTRHFVCVMFSDIRGYTARSEGMAPEEVIRFVNRYFERVVALIHAHGGSVMCFMGDGIMAVFGAPNPLENPCRSAFGAARDVLAYVGELNGELRAENVNPIEIGVGLNAGEAVVGHVGSSTRHDYSAIGDVTNVASRVEGLTKEAGYRVVVTRAVAELLGPDAGLAPLGPMAIKGHAPVEVFGYDEVGEKTV